MHLLEPEKIENRKCERAKISNISRYVKTGMIQKMINFCQSKGGIGLAAPQIGLFERFFIAFVNGKWHLFVNPAITTKGDEIDSIEECLSYPGLKVKLKRYSEVIVINNLLGRVLTMKLTGRDAIVVQHEYDHLNGITINTKLISGEATKAD